MRYLIILLALVVVLSAAIVDAAVVNTPHDIAYYINGQSIRYVCVNCHTPHQGTSPAVSQLLWNRNRASNATVFYNSATFDMGSANATNAGPQTNLCLACHDGAASTLVNYPGPGSTANSNYDLAVGDISNWANIGTDLSQEHPVAFVYNASLDQDNNDFPAASNGIITGNRTNTPYRLYSNDTFQCATCHSVHDTATYSGKGNTEVYFLRTSNASSQMCNDCHVNR
jgi:nitrate/TMAO reductase-like tetraheme cytochrome c subunit